MTAMQSHLDAAIGPQGYALHGQDVLDWEDWEPPWHGASAKLSRAEEHYWALHSEVWRFLTEVPPAIRFDASPDLGPDWYTFSVKFSEPPIRIAIIFGDMVANLRSALDELDERAAQAVLDQLFGALTVEAVIREVLMPYLHELGDRWQRGDVTVGQEHFASNIIRSRLAALSTGWGAGHGPRALLACPPGELHDIALLSFGLILRRSGWRVVFLGADSPMADVERTAAALGPDLVMLSASDHSRFDAVRPQLVELSKDRSVVLAGAGASNELAATVGAQYVGADPVTAAERLAER